MDKDERFEVVKMMIESGKLTEFSKIFTYIPKNILVEELGSSHRRVSRFARLPEKVEVGDIIILSKLIGVKTSTVFELVERQIVKAEGAKKMKTQKVNQ